MSEMEKKIIFNEDVIYVHPENMKGFLPKSTPMPKKKTLVVNVDGIDITVILKGGKAIENKFDSFVELAGYTLETAQYYWLSRSEAIELAYKKDPNDHYGIEGHTFATMSDDAPKADKKTIEMRVDFLRDVYKLLANDNALTLIANAAEKKKNKTLYKGRYVHIAFSGLLTDYDYNTIEIVAKAKDDKTLEIYPETRPFSQEEYEKIENDIFASAAKDYNNLDKVFDTAETTEIKSKSKKKSNTVKFIFNNKEYDVLVENKNGLVVKGIKRDFPIADIPYVSGDEENGFTVNPVIMQRTDIRAGANPISLDLLFDGLESALESYKVFAEFIKIKKYKNYRPHCSRFIWNIGKPDNPSENYPSGYSDLINYIFEKQKVDFRYINSLAGHTFCEYLSAIKYINEMSDDDFQKLVDTFPLKKNGYLVVNAGEMAFNDNLIIKKVLFKVIQNSKNDIKIVVLDRFYFW